eukprot:CAMPEP_0204327920 /NCGR_PEP_ID=MMETSP0469-20131031/12976_1 /ASSEMBLY_ACC=CAM_ASM_000384 /TAXON_ID=2969 /ORGANISM="Oxyrrhis marina" /LENGTH=153 /DNA_ID=CAMNT_0051310229 /DNA_START=19 /DNA_END=480 /DNA_ORIENTATION=+
MPFDLFTSFLGAPHMADVHAGMHNDPSSFFALDDGALHHKSDAASFLVSVPFQQGQMQFPNGQNGMNPQQFMNQQLPNGMIPPNNQMPYMQYMGGPMDDPSMNPATQGASGMSPGAVTAVALSVASVVGGSVVFCWMRGKQARRDDSDSESDA